MAPEQIDNLFSYHAPKTDQTDRYNLIRFEARKLAHLITQNTPSSAEQTLAIRSLHTCVMQANAAIAINE